MEEFVLKFCLVLIPALYPESMNINDQAGFLTFPALHGLPDLWSVA